MRVALPLVAALLLAGCTTPTPGADDHGDGHAAATPAPWWPVGAWWDVRLTRGAATDEVRLVNFLNASDHFWLGVAHRATALEHALHDTNPLLGRIHWGILTPHEKGIHADGLFTFPITPGESWSGKFLGRDWSLKAAAGATAGTLAITGTANDGAKVAYDYDPASMWFTDLKVTGPDGKVEWRFEVTGHGLDARGTYWFLRGRDYYEGPKGGVEDTFLVCGPNSSETICRPEERPVKSLAVEFDATFSAPGRVEFIDPSGAVRKEHTVAQGRVQEVVEIPNPAPGAWKVRYVGGVPTGKVHGTGLLEYTASL